MKRTSMRRLEKALSILEEKPATKNVLRRIAKILKMMAKIGK